jgi:hypothetical protein
VNMKLNLQLTMEVGNVFEWMLPSPGGMWCMELVHETRRHICDFCWSIHKSILTLWCMSDIPVMHSDTQNAVQQFNTLCMQPSRNFRCLAHHMGNLIPAPKVNRAKEQL